MDLVHVQGEELEEIRRQAYQAASEVCEGAKLREGDLFVVGCSTSEVLGEKIRRCRSGAFFWQPSAVNILAEH